MEVAALQAKLLEALPQTQCTRCSYPDCSGYAEAIATQHAGINQCPPGGQAGVVRLAELAGVPVIPLDPAFGVEGPRSVAFIDENWCIGCTLCIDVCPTDAILGTNKQMHTVVEPHCTGCALCLPVCPVDCIYLENVSGEQTGWNAWSIDEAEKARKRYLIHSTRRSNYLPETSQRSSRNAADGSDTAPTGEPLPAERDAPPRQSFMDGVLARVRSQREKSGLAARELLSPQQPQQTQKPD